MDEYRINKYIALCGICSRREADGLIEAGRVLINGKKAELGSRVTDKDEVTLDGKAVKPEEK
ncbi:MAG: 23S rRNA pseudouridine synthase F, partial [Lachnospiraceae bacterium]|nr:23S rRNA pseudouridine synthase F [Lachnospiraceae bacterium]